MIIINSLFLEYIVFLCFLYCSYLIFGSTLLFCFRCYLLLNLKQWNPFVPPGMRCISYEWTILRDRSSKLQEITCLVCAQALALCCVCVCASSSALHVHFACLSQEPEHTLTHTHTYAVWAVFSSIMQFDATCHIW